MFVYLCLFVCVYVCICVCNSDVVQLLVALIVEGNGRDIDRSQDRDDVKIVFEDGEASEREAEVRICVVCVYVGVSLRAIDAGVYDI